MKKDEPDGSSFLVWHFDRFYVMTHPVGMPHHCRLRQASTVRRSAPPRRGDSPHQFKLFIKAEKRSNGNLAATAFDWANLASAKALALSPFRWCKRAAS